ncbi:MAG TPA: C25 family cysteine peptidase [Verrucomicrobiae bacterium]|nr:C25 family cysteine peptidase [Verrucomicrobiae bacterium]
MKLPTLILFILPLLNPTIAAPASTKLLIIAPQAFSSALQPLLAHKSRTGMPARLITLEFVRAASLGKDDPEKVKRAIADAHEKLGVQYVMLVGDASQMPVRFRHVRQLPADASIDGSYNPSDLYYANLYQGHAPENVPDDPLQIQHSGNFDTWDLDNNGRYNEQHWHDDAVSYNPDRVDGCPDIAVGRVPAHTAKEVQTYVAKIIRYETGQPHPGSFGRFTFVADKGYGGSQQLSDDIISDSIARAFPGVATAFEKLYLNCEPNEFVGAPWGRGDFDAIDAASKRCWWVTYVGHAGPRYWAIYEKNRGYDDGRVSKLSNPDALPIVYTIGCESGMFMTCAPTELYRDQQERYHDFVWHEASRTWEDKRGAKNIPAPLAVPQPFAYDLPDKGDRTFACSWLTAYSGGAIAFFGQTVVCEADKAHDLEKEMFLRYAAGDRVLGDLWRNGQRKYWINNRASQSVFRNPRIYLGIMTFFGDPSLRLRTK